jgi:hypothetical protein
LGSARSVRHDDRRRHRKLVTGSPLRQRADIVDRERDGTGHLPLRGHAVGAVSAHPVHDRRRLRDRRGP